jgi:hemolysin activation/secretion protein
MKVFLLLGGLLCGLVTACATIASAQDAAQTNATATATQSANDTPAAATNSAPAQATNAAPTFAVSGYRVLGNTLLSDDVLQSIFAKHIGTNMSIPQVLAAATELQQEYSARGFATVAVSLPQQTLANGVVVLQVTEATLSDITISNPGWQYFSSNNVMAALPSLHTNMILNSRVFQSELDRANNNRDRQIYPVISPGAEPGTTALKLDVRDQLPLHGKMELNNQSAQDTPENRLNSSISYANLWQAEHTAGFQYSFSPEKMKEGDQWEFYDRPLIANYSAFYRLPLSTPDSVADVVANRPQSFGYNEATRRFDLPASTGAREFNLYASRSTVDTGVTYSPLTRLFTAANRTIDQRTDHQDITINENIGARLTQPLPEMSGIHSTFSVGADYKRYHISSFTTNNFIFTEHLIDSSGNPFTRTTITPSAVPSSSQDLDYLPLSLRWDGSRQDLDNKGRFDFGLGYSPNLWFSGTTANLQAIAGSPHATGQWNIFTGNLAREQTIYKEWKLNLRVDGQWASEPLISNEQFGVGGVNGVRGYREGEVFGSSGWRVTSEQKTPPFTIGYIGDTPEQPNKNHPLTVRASVFMDYAEVYNPLPQPGQPGRTPLWGAGLGGVATIGSTFEAHLMFSFPLLTTPTTEKGQIRVSFALSAQF